VGASPELRRLWFRRTGLRQHDAPIARWALSAKRQELAIIGVVLASLSLGGVATLTVAGISDAVFVDSLSGVSSPERLFMPHARWPAGLFNAFSYRQFALIRVLPDVESAAAFTHRPVSLRSERAVTRAEAALVTSDYFRLLGIRMVPGVSPPASDVDTDPRAIYVGRRVASLLLGDSEHPIGSTLYVNGVPFRVAGVLGGAFRGIELSSPCDVFIPVAAASVAYPPMASTLVSEGPLARELPWLSVVLRLRHGGSARRTEASVTQATSDTRPVALLGFTESTLPLEERARVGRFVELLALSVGFLWAAIIGSMGILFLSWQAGERRSDAVHVALGASRAHLLRKWLARGVSLGLFAALLAMGFGYWSFPAICERAFPGQLPGGAIGTPPSWHAVALMVLTVVAAGIVAAAVGTKGGRDACVRHGFRMTEGEDVLRRSQMTLVVVQVIVAVAALSVAVSLGRQVRRELSADVGFTRHTVRLAGLDLESLGHNGEHSIGLWDRLLARVREMPDVRAATVTTGYFGRAAGLATAIWVDGHERRCHAFINHVGPWYFETLGIQLLRGRDFDAGDAVGHPLVVVVNASLAASLWPGRDALDRTISLGQGLPSLRVVGVAGNTVQKDLTHSDDPGLYLPFRQYPERAAQDKVLAIRTDMSSGRARQAMNEALRTVEPSAAFDEIGTLNSAIEATLVPHRVAARLFGAVVVLDVALLLAAVYGVVRNVVLHRLREIGVRGSMGQTPTGIAVWIAGTCLGRPFATGLVCGIAVALALSVVISSRIERFHTLEVLPVLGASLAVLGTALLAGLLPIWRAVRAEPARLLRTD
jgi:putative ABC transport system permease protein